MGMHNLFGVRTAMGWMLFAVVVHYCLMSRVVAYPSYYDAVSCVMSFIISCLLYGEHGEWRAPIRLCAHPEDSPPAGTSSYVSPMWYVLFVI